MSLTKAGTIVRINSRKGATMNLKLSDWDWLNAALGVLFLYRGIRDLYNGTGTGWSSEDEKKHFRKFYGIASILCGALYLVNTFLPRVEPLHSILMVACDHNRTFRHRVRHFYGAASGRCHCPALPQAVHAGT